MTERQSSTISIKRRNSVVLTVPIGEGSVRKFALMSEDSITLAFELQQPVHIAIGDYIDDELFGHFVVTKEQKPQYNASTGGYQYAIQFDAEYMAWGNRLMMFVDGTTRKEAQWFLTSDIETHANEVIKNAAAIGHTGYTVQIHPEVENATEYRLVSYESVTILAALNLIADTWGCEWWIAGKVLHFGKCQTTAAPLQFENGQNVESMSISDNRSHYANRIYAFGSTDNIPPTYRRQLRLKINGRTRKQGEQTGPWYYSTDKKITQDMFPAIKPIEIPILRGTFNKTGEIAGNVFYEGYKGVGDIDTERIYHLSAGINTFIAATGVAPNTDIAPNTPYQVTYRQTARLILHGTTDYILAVASNTATATINNNQNPTFVVPSIQLPGVESNIQIKKGHYELYLAYEFGVEGYTNARLAKAPVCSSPPCIYLVISQGEKGSAPIKVSDADGKWENAYVRVNIDGVDRYREDGTENPFYYALVFCDAAGQVTSEPSEFAYNDTLVIDPSSETIYVPSAYYTTDSDNPAALSRIGEPRLQLPISTQGYIDSGNYTQDSIVEEAVIFADIYPRCDLRVSAIEEERKTDHQEYEGEEVTTDWKWTQYTMQLKRADGEEFPFSDKYLLPGAKMQIKFMTPEDVTELPDDEETPQCKMAGMTFEVQFDAGRYTLVRNDTYGALLPSEVIRPHIGDPCVLIGWNPRAIQDIGLIDQAEQRLLAKAQEYAAAMEEGQFTFDCTMMSDFITGSIPKEGQRVTIRHGSLKQPKTSRIIGYELKLDKPYDSPRYTVGETQAYSRLANIEREINKKQ